ncbi:MAG: PDZ domain-containing protein, partial [Erysipelotrichaceae bacterium]
MEKIKVERYEWPDEAKTRKDKRNKKIIIIVFCAFLFVSGLFLGGKIYDLTNSETSKFNTIKQIMNEKWAFKDEAKKDLMLDATNGMVNSKIDPHTMYFTKEQMAQFNASMENTFVGIGVEYRKVEESVIIINVLLNSPAAYSGLQMGDMITKVDGQEIKNKTTDEIKALVTGKEGTSVIITYLRNQEEKQVNIVRKKIDFTVNSTIYDNVGYLNIKSFGSTTAKEVFDHLTNFENNKISKVVIDLRNNGGGYLEALNQIASFFLEKDQVVFKQRFVDNKITTHTSKG